MFDLDDRACLLCKLTRDHPGTRALYRVVDTGASTGVFRALVAVLAPGEVGQELVKEFRALQEHDEFEVLAFSPYSLTLKVGHKLAASLPAGTTARLVTGLLDFFGTDTILEPLLFERGRVRVRAIVPQPLETKRVLARLQELRANQSWESFRVLRVAEYRATKYAEILRRILTPDEEALLRFALSLGYYNSPKGCTLEDIARRVGLSVSPVHKKLKGVEQSLINAYIEPASARPPKVRKRAARVSIANMLGGNGSSAGPVEVSLRIRWSGSELAGFVEKHPDARIVFQHLAEDPRAGVATGLLVVVAPGGETAELEASLRANARIASIELVSRDDEHMSVKLRTKLATDDDARRHPDPFPRLLARFGRDAFLRPLVIEGSDIWLRFVVARAIDPEVLDDHLAAIANELGWDGFDLVNVRPADVDPVLAPLLVSEKVTARQEEVLRIAHALGYYKTPRESTLEDVAQNLGVSANAIHKNLTAAEQKIIATYLATAP